MTSDKSAEKLLELIRRRGEIAHRVESSEPVSKKNVTDYQNLIFRLAVITHNRALALIAIKTKRRPWRRYKHGKTT